MLNSSFLATSFFACCSIFFSFVFFSFILLSGFLVTAVLRLFLWLWLGGRGLLFGDTTANHDNFRLSLRFIELFLV